MCNPSDLEDQLLHCPLGSVGWSEFENVNTRILTYLFVPPLQSPRIQPRTYSGIDRRDAIFPNRNYDTSTIWGQLRHELDARMILFEFKNYDSSDITKEEVIQTHSYLSHPIGKLGIIITTKDPDRSAYIKRNTIYSEEGKVILFLSKENIIEMLHIKERGDDPAMLIMDIVESFYIGWE
jgi:hypothetical protein